MEGGGPRLAKGRASEDACKARLKRRGSIFTVSLAAHTHTHTHAHAHAQGEDGVSRACEVWLRGLVAIGPIKALRCLRRGSTQMEQSQFVLSRQH